MKDLPTITVHIAPHVLAFLQAYAHHMTDQMKRDGRYLPGDEVTAESVASLLLEQAARQLMGPDADAQQREEQQ